MKFVVTRSLILLLIRPWALVSLSSSSFHAHCAKILSISKKQKMQWLKFYWVWFPGLDQVYLEVIFSQSVVRWNLILERSISVKMRMVVNDPGIVIHYYGRFFQMAIQCVIFKYYQCQHSVALRCDKMLWFVTELFGHHSVIILSFHTVFQKSIILRRISFSIQDIDEDTQRVSIVNIRFMANTDFRKYWQFSCVIFLPGSDPSTKIILDL